MAATAVILADGAESGFEGIEVFYACFGCLRIISKLSEPRFEVAHTLPDLRTGSIRIIRRRLVDQILLEQSGPLGRCVLKCRKNLVSLCKIERSLALGHGGPDFGLVPILLHKGFTRGNRILLGCRNAYCQPNCRDSAERTDHVFLPSLYGLTPSRKPINWMR